MRPIAAPSLLLLLASSAAAQTITGLGSLPEGGMSWATAISDDGALVVGFGYTAEGSRALRWTRATGLQDLGTLTAATFYHPRGVSNDGFTIVGQAVGDWPYREFAFLWTPHQGMTDLGVLDRDTDAVATGVSADGAAVSGYSYHTNDMGQIDRTRAFRWTPQTGMAALPTLPGGTFAVATAISRDGRTIVGYGDQPGFRYTVGIAWVNGQAHPIDCQDQPTDLVPAAANPDGTVVVGGWGHVTRWDPSGTVRDLGYFTGGPGPSFGLSTNARGTLIGGCTGHPFLPEEGLLWTPSRGLMSAHDYLALAGIDMWGWLPSACFAITPDGRAIVGVATHYTDDTHATWEAFIATLPRCGSSDFNRDGDSGTDADIEAFFACLAGDCCPTCDIHGADFDGDADPATDADIEAFFRVLAGAPC
jgi:probable HAF family extracellular repeat protein